MSKLTVFVYEGIPIRIISQNGEPWFVATDLREVLSLGSARQALAQLDSDEIGRATVGHKQRTAIVSESGMYALVSSSLMLSEAKAFRKWITSEALPNFFKANSQKSAPQSQLPETVSVVLASLDAALSGVIDSQLLAEAKLNAIAALYPETSLALAEGYKALFSSAPPIKKAPPPVDPNCLLTPTRVGELLGITARKVNQLLIEAGLQAKNPDQTLGAATYIPLDKGLPLAKATLAMKAGEISYWHLKWYPGVIEVLRPYTCDQR